MLNHRMGGRGYIQNEIGVYPAHDLRIWELMEAQRYDEAQTLFDSVVPKLREFGATVGKRFGHRGGAKAALALMGRPIGGYRPPGEPLDGQETEELRQLLLGFGWPVSESAHDVAAAD